ncbi:glycosyltransferase family 2 protein [Alteromonas sp. ASW11-130]|uniref:glycosyltransferase family 2 protein n=1 Tax=Alteromonas sp. ASW11-130 TaxID=3015775 RepID=UPI0022422854|nr:galactosyltransferase-related protein [Alteromonas sp. ASW11-130]MCW8090968.1 galactosyltransferase-related protein [Alteromonas sp. ASW11-130]
MRTEFSIVTIVKGRLRQLSNLIGSIENANLCPKELIVVWMAPPCSESLMTSQHFAIHHKFVANEPLPIAKARNKGFQACITDKIIYMDVDCICSPELFDGLLKSLEKKRVVMPQVRYLNSIPEHCDYHALTTQAAEDPAKPWLPLNHDIGFENFSTLTFAINQADFDDVGGFDEAFHGYGVGDMDFASRCEAEGLSLYLIPEEVLHQYHPTFDPPINHLFDIVNNASVFKRKWGRYPLEQYLKQFAEEGLINADYHEAGLRVKRMPSQDEIYAHLSSKRF